MLLAVRDGDDALLVERLSGHHAIPVLYRVGGRLPLHSTGVGLVLLAFADPDFQERYLSQPLTQEPENTPVAPAALRRSLAAVRRERVITFRRKVPQPVMSVATPIFGAQETVSRRCPSSSRSSMWTPACSTPALRTAARAISRGVGARQSIGLAPG